MPLVTALPCAGKAIMIITHDEEVAGLTHRILAIWDGLVAEERVMEG